MNDNSKNLTKFALITIGLILIFGIIIFFILRSLEPHPPLIEEDSPLIEEGRPPPPPPPPPPPIEPKSMKIRYPEGRIIQATTNFTISGAGKLKDWGIRGEASFILNGIFQTEMTITESSEERFSGTLRVTESKVEDLVLGDPKLQIDAGDRAHLLATGTILTAQAFYGDVAGVTIPPGTTRIVEKLSNEVLASGPVKNMLKGHLEKFVEGKIEIGKLQGVEIDFDYENGTGFSSFELSNAPKLSEREEELKTLVAECRPTVQGAVSLFDRIFPEDEAKEPGSEWSFDLINLPTQWPDGLNGGAGGEVTFQRKQDPGPSKALALISKSKDVYLGISPKDRIYRITVNQAAGGILLDTKREFVEQFTLVGKGDATIRSTDHWIFEVRHEVKPTLDLKIITKINDENVNR